MAAPVACGSSQARDRTFITAVTRATTMTTSDLKPAESQENSQDLVKCLIKCNKIKEKIVVKV